MRKNEIIQRLEALHLPYGQMLAEIEDSEIALLVRASELIMRNMDTVLVKYDGGRIGDGDAAPYTVVISGPSLGDDYIRVEASEYVDCYGAALLEYLSKYG